MLPTHAAVIHAILMHRLNAGVEEHAGRFPNALKHLGGNSVFVIGWLEAHDADEFRAQPLHSGNGSPHLTHSDFPRRLDGLGPVHNGGTETIDTDARGFEFLNAEVKGFIWNLMEIGLGEAGHFNPAHLKMLPA